MLDGMLILYKPVGITSHDAVEKVRKAYGVKAGHAGTLDPIAQGVLLVFLNNALKLLQFLPYEWMDKTYLMKITLGKTTDSYDSTGKVTFEYKNQININIEQILSTFKKFVGQIKQTPPAFSALKVNGKRAYELARSGKYVELKPRIIHINSLRLIKVLQTCCSEDNNQILHHLLLRVHCSRGTYIRSLAHDIGQELGYGGFLSYLLRERVGCWTFKQSFPLWKVEQKIDFAKSESFIKISDILPFPKVIIKDEAIIKVLNGAQIETSDIFKIENFQPSYTLSNDKLVLQIFSKKNELIALYTKKEGIMPHINTTPRTHANIPSNLNTYNSSLKLLLKPLRIIKTNKEI